MAFFWTRGSIIAYQRKCASYPICQCSMYTVGRILNARMFIRDAIKERQEKEHAMNITRDHIKCVLSIANVQRVSISYVFNLLVSLYRKRSSIYYYSDTNIGRTKLLRSSILREDVVMRIGAWSDVAFYNQSASSLAYPDIESGLQGKRLASSPYRFPSCSQCCTCSIESMTWAWGRG